MKKKLEKNSIQFRERSQKVTVFKFERVSVLNLEKINQDNSELDNYRFSGEMKLFIADEKTNGENFISPSSTFFEGSAKVNEKDKNILITQPINISHR